jgi:hypothetical protein
MNNHFITTNAHFDAARAIERRLGGTKGKGTNHAR